MFLSLPPYSHNDALFRYPTRPRSSPDTRARLDLPHAQLHLGDIREKEITQWKTGRRSRLEGIPMTKRDRIRIARGVMSTIGGRAREGDDELAPFCS